MKRIVPVAAALALSCATATPRREESLSAAQHRQEAARERTLASQETTPYQVTVWPGDGKAHAIDLAARHLRHAEQHEAAAVALEASEEQECKSIPPKARAACPLLGPVQELLDRGDGVRIVFPPDTDVAALLARMRCHLAFARARGFSDVAECPLYMRDVDISAPAADGNAIEVRSRDAAIAYQIQIRARASIAGPRASTGGSHGQSP